MKLMLNRVAKTLLVVTVASASAIGLMVSTASVAQADDGERKRPLVVHRDDDRPTIRREENRQEESRREAARREAARREVARREQSPPPAPSEETRRRPLHRDDD
ncbi:MAG: hypothetical protein ACFB16_26920 [Phormidesmis sp.]